MKDYFIIRDRVQEDKEEVYVLDTAAFIAGIPLSIVSSISYTTSSVVEEVKDSNSRSRLEYVLSTSRVIVKDPEDKFVRMIIERSKNIDKDLPRFLSDTDISILALALELKRLGYTPIIFTDDFLIHKVASHIRIASIGVRRSKPTNVSKVKGKVFECVACGYRSYTRLKNNKCPVCGSRLTIVY